MSKDYINIERMSQTLKELYADNVDNPSQYEDYIENYAGLQAQQLNEDMNVYLHKEDTRINGNFANVREDWETTKNFVKSDVTPWDNTLNDVVNSIDNDTIPQEQLQQFQTWLTDWFFTAFGTYNLVYNFLNDIGEFMIDDMEE